MPLNIYLNFKNQARDAIELYEKVFSVKCQDIMTYGEVEMEGAPLMDEATKKLIMNASIEMEGTKVMFADVPDFMEYKPGDNITLVIDTSDETQLTTQFNQLAEGGKITMPLTETFWSKKYGQVIDKFGIGWQFNLS
ncbi:VOC family protein [Carnobacterium divergens]|uniref:VOC family protein n=1 Tax=Carnobacterium divergens TaxID=2748 RepID=UPI0028912C25|nr:VOC family protein [Carnobacterium divergens]MDT2012092.1 VOC family protein [Carnobacterium divergens]